YSILRPAPTPTSFPYTTLFRSSLPAHVHADPDEGDDDASILTDRPLAEGAHPRTGQDLQQGILRRRRFLARVGICQRPDEIGAVVVGDVLQRIGDALHEVLLGDDGHGYLCDLATAMPEWTSRSRILPLAADSGPYASLPGSAGWRSRQRKRVCADRAILMPAAAVGIVGDI